MLTDPATDEAALNARHADKMRRQQAAKHKMMAERTEERGLIVVHTGTGKGKTSAALGMVMRHLAYGWPVGIIQFTKSPDYVTGEAVFLSRFPDLVTLAVTGEGFTWDTQDRARDAAVARDGWEQAKALIREGEHRLVLLDEINIVLRNESLPLDEVVAFLRDERPDHVHVVATGRNAKPELVEIADLVTEMTLVKHPYRAGVKAQKGIEF